MPTLFLAYAFPDREFAARVKLALDQKGVGVWDWFAGLPDSDWGRVFPAIESSDAFVFIITNQAVESRACLQELDYAVQLGKSIFALHREMVPSEALPEALKRLQRESPGLASKAGSLRPTTRLAFTYLRRLIQTSHGMPSRQAHLF